MGSRWRRNADFNINLACLNIFLSGQVKIVINSKLKVQLNQALNEIFLKGHKGELKCGLLQLIPWTTVHGLFYFRLVGRWRGCLGQPKLCCVQQEGLQVYWFFGMWLSHAALHWKGRLWTSWFEPDYVPAHPALRKNQLTKRKTRIFFQGWL